MFQIKVHKQNAAEVGAYYFCYGVVMIERERERERERKERKRRKRDMGFNLHSTQTRSFWD